MNSASAVTMVFTVVNSVLLVFLLVRQIREWRIVRLQQEKIELEVRVLRDGKSRAVYLASNEQLDQYAPDVALPRLRRNSAPAVRPDPHIPETAPEIVPENGPKESAEETYDERLEVKRRLERHVINLKHMHVNLLNQFAWEERERLREYTEPFVIREMDRLNEKISEMGVP